MVTYVDGRPTSLIAIEYVRQSERSSAARPAWRPAYMETIVYDSLGRRAALLTATYTERGTALTTTSPAGGGPFRSAPTRLAASVARAAGAVARAVLPDAAHAQRPAETLPVAGSVGCAAQSAAAIDATLQASLSGAAAGAAVTLCTLTRSPSVCAEAVTLGLEASRAVYEMGVAIAQLITCTLGSEGNSGDGTGGGASGGGASGGEGGGGGGNGIGGAYCTDFEESYYDWSSGKQITHVHKICYG